eukprot:8757803-Lingulodinium_polyedra.AAC.1
MANAIAIIRGLTPEGIRNGWTQLSHTGPGQRVTEEAWETTLWVARSGREHGFRAPTAEGRSWCVAGAA